MTALTVSGLSKSFGGPRVTDGVDLKVDAGERRLIIGPNGAGKTTLFNLITGEIAPDSGAVALLGQDITRIPCRQRAHLGLARTYQIITLFPHDTILRNANAGAWRLPWRWPSSPRCCCSTSLLPASPSTSGAMCKSYCSKSRAP